MTPSAIPRVAIVGRQNVGQVHARQPALRPARDDRARLARASPAIASRSQTTWRGRTFGLVDTAGFVTGARGVEAAARTQADRAIADADVIVLVVDAPAGIAEEDAALARRLRRATVPVLLVANKVDTDKDETDVRRLPSGSAWASPFPVSGLHGRATGDLLDRIVALLPDVRPEREDTAARAALRDRGPSQRRQVEPVQPSGRGGAIGRLRRGRHHAGRGRRRRRRGRRAPCGSSTPRGCGAQCACRASSTSASCARPRRSNARDVVAPRDRRGAGVHRGGQEDREPRHRRRPRVPARREQVGPRRREGQDVPRPPGDAETVRRATVRCGRRPSRGGACTVSHRCCSTSTPDGPLRVPTSKVNEVIQQAQRERPTPRIAGTLHYATQVSAGPPSFVIFGGAREPDAGYRRYLENRLRDAFGFEGVPSPPCASEPAHDSGPSGTPCNARPVQSAAAGRGAAWLARLTGGQKVAGSNPAGPTDEGDGGLRTGIVRDPHDPERPLEHPHPPDPGLLRPDRPIPRPPSPGSCCSWRSWRPTGSTDWVARRTGQVSELGKVLDPVADRLAIASGLIALVIRGAFPLWAALLILVRDAAVLIVGAVVLRRQHPRRRALRRQGRHLQSHGARSPGSRGATSATRWRRCSSRRLARLRGGHRRVLLGGRSSTSVTSGAPLRDRVDGPTRYRVR